jgi:FtsZ-interacting cell division protein ZipA
MVEWWYVLVIGIVVVLIIAVVGVRNRQERERYRPDDRANRNYVGEREDTRLGGMSAEDRDWEQASLQRNRDRQASQATPGGNQAAPPERADRGAGEQ